MNKVPEDSSLDFFEEYQHAVDDILKKQGFSYYLINNEAEALKKILLNIDLGEIQCSGNINIDLPVIERVGVLAAHIQKLLSEPAIILSEEEKWFLVFVNNLVKKPLAHWIGDFVYENKLLDIATHFNAFVLIDLHTKDFTERLINLLPGEIVNARKDLVTTELKLSAVAKNPKLIYILNESEVTSEIANSAFNEDHELIYHIPKSMITKEMTEAAYTKDASLAIHFPEKFITEDILIGIIEKDASLFRLIKNKFDDKLITERLCRKAIEKSLLNVVVCPEKYVTDEDYMKAFESSYWIYRALPNRLKTMKVSIRACIQNNIMIRFVPSDLLTVDFCMEILKKSPSAINEFPGDICEEIKRKASQEGIKYEIDFIPF